MWASKKSAIERGASCCVEESKPTHWTPASTQRVHAGTLPSHLVNVSTGRTRAEKGVYREFTLPTASTGQDAATDFGAVLHGKRRASGVCTTTVQLSWRR
jgi:hypothetical protein